MEQAGSFEKAVASDLGASDNDANLVAVPQTPKYGISGPIASRLESEVGKGNFNSCTDDQRKAVMDLIQGVTVVVSNNGNGLACNLREGRACTLVKTKVFRLLRKAEDEHFAITWDAMKLVIHKDTPCSMLEKWAGTTDSTLFIDAKFQKKATGRRVSDIDNQFVGGKWSWTTRKTCLPVKTTALQYGQFCKNTGKNRRNHCKKSADGKRFVPDLVSDIGFGLECNIY